MELGEVQGRERSESLFALAGQDEPDRTMIVFVSGAANESSMLCTIDQFDRAVVTAAKTSLDTARKALAATRVRLGDPKKPSPPTSAKGWR